VSPLLSSVDVLLLKRTELREYIPVSIEVIFILYIYLYLLFDCLCVSCRIALSPYLQYTIYILVKPKIEKKNLKIISRLFNPSPPSPSSHTLKMTNGPLTTKGNLVKNGIYLAFPCSTCPNTNKVKIHMDYPRSRSRGYITWGPWIKVTPKTA
jgi:hypothetical protein